jgi:hypothetical protein
MSQSTRKTWISVLIASVIIVGLLAVAAIGGTAFFIYGHVNTQFTPSDNAEQQFAEARARFTGQQPLIEIRKDDEPVLHREIIPGSLPAAKLDTLKRHGLRAMVHGPFSEDTFRKLASETAVWGYHLGDEPYPEEKFPPIAEQFRILVRLLVLVGRKRELLEDVRIGGLHRLQAAQQIQWLLPVRGRLDPGLGGPKALQQMGKAVWVGRLR